MVGRGHLDHLFIWMEKNYLIQDAGVQHRKYLRRFVHLIFVFCKVKSREK